MPDQITDNQNPGGDDITNPTDTTWYEPFAADKPELAETLGKFDTFDSFLEDYNGAKNRDWRAELAGDDDKFKSQLERFATPDAFGNAYREAQQKIRSGQLRPELPEDADEDAIKEFRRENNIPLEASGYLDNLPDGLVVGEDDKELMLDFLGAIHEKNAPPEIAHAVVDWYNDFEEKQQEAIVELDNEQAREATDQLREDWGKDFRGNMNLIKGTLETYFGKEAADQLANGRFQDGRGFFNDPNVLKGIAELARKVNDVAPLIEGDPQKVQSLHDEIKEIESKMGTKEYKQDDQMQARLRELYDIRLSLEKDDAA